MDKNKGIKTVRDEIVVDSRDVDRAIEVAIRRKQALVEDETVNGRVVDEEVLLSQQKKK